MSTKKPATVKTKTENTSMDPKELARRIEAKLLSRGVPDPTAASAEQLYHAVVYVVKDILNRRRTQFKKRMKAADSKRVCYLCMEFLIGRSFDNHLRNLGLREALCKVLEGYGKTYDQIFSCEVDPGLGNGGLGRLAACFMDSLTALDYSANGYSLLYETGLFRQKLVEGE
jgi:starch phosphorylase